MVERKTVTAARSRTSREEARSVVQRTGLMGLGLTTQGIGLREETEP
jgi:hypothetical protein